METYKRVYKPYWKRHIKHIENYQKMFRNCCCDFFWFFSELFRNLFGTVSELCRNIFGTCSEFVRNCSRNAFATCSELFRNLFRTRSGLAFVYVSYMFPFKWILLLVCSASGRRRLAPVPSLTCPSTHPYRFLINALYFHFRSFFGDNSVSLTRI